MEKVTLVQSLNLAVEGVVYVFKNQRNMRIHFLLAVLVLLLALVFNVDRIEWMLLCFSLTLVLFAEMINTAMEETLDLVSREYHPVVRIIKDVSAGAVLLAAVNAVVVGYLVFSRFLDWPIERTLFRIRNAPWHITFAALVAVLLFVVLGKIFFQRGTPFEGGMPSGHAAVAFSLWSSIIFLQSNLLVNLITFLMALLIALSRLRYHIHSLLEIFIGSVLGMLVTTLFFQIFR